MLAKLKVIPIILTAALIFASFYLALDHSLAQDATPAPSLVYQKPELKKEIDEVSRTYGGQLSEYRRADQEFQIARSQYQQLNTLASLETAIVATRQVMVKRSQVLDTYFNLMRLELLNAQGLRIEYREFALDQIDAHRRALAVHQDQAGSALEREAVAKVADEFTQLVEPMQLTMEFGVNVLKLSQYQALYDITEVSLSKISGANSDQSDSEEATAAGLLQSGQDQRAFEQILVQFERAGQALADADQQVLVTMEAMEDESANRRNTSLDLAEEIEVTYSALSQTYRYMGELLGRQS